jgi:hypothetical protein
MDAKDGHMGYASTNARFDGSDEIRAELLY